MTVRNAKWAKVVGAKKRRFHAARVDVSDAESVACRTQCLRLYIQQETPRSLAYLVEMLRRLHASGGLDFSPPSQKTLSRWAKNYDWKYQVRLHDQTVHEAMVKKIAVKVAEGRIDHSAKLATYAALAIDKATKEMKGSTYELVISAIAALRQAQAMLISGAADMGADLGKTERDIRLARFAKMLDVTPRMVAAESDSHGTLNAGTPEAKRRSGINTPPNAGGVRSDLELEAVPGGKDTG